jgi:DNA-directed RNA polymerase beta' subunit
MDLMAWNKNFDGTLPEPDIKAGSTKDQLPKDFPLHKYKTDQDLWSGRTILSTVIPPINLVKKNDSHSENDPLNYQNIVKIVQGKVESGVFDKGLLGGKEQGVIHLIYNEYGPKKAKEFLDNITAVVTNWLLMSGFSVGVSDLMINEDAQKTITEIINNKKSAVSSIVQSIHDGTFKNDSGKSNANEFEIKVNGALNEAIQDTGKVVAKHQLKTNRMVNMVESGSKGTKVNIAQVTACVGQQNVDGKRCPYGFSNRTLPHFNKYDDGPLARGFVENSFLGGLNPQEFFFHAMGGREGIIDTAIKTSESGYIQRKLIKAMEDVKVCQDQTVRNNMGSIIQFLYGEDGMNPEKIEKQKIMSVLMSLTDLEKNYLISPTEAWIKYLVPSLATKYQNMTVNERKVFYNTMAKHYQDILADRRYMIEKVYKMTMNDEVYYPVNIRRLITNAQNMFKSTDTNFLSDLDPVFVLEHLDKLCGKLIIKDINPANKVFSVLIRSTLSPKYLISQTKLNKQGFEYIIEQIEYRFSEAFAIPGLLVGTIAAQSLGEPVTQMTLNSVSYDTELLLKINDNIKIVKIGEYIDNYIPISSKTEDHPNNTKLAYINDDEEIYVPSVDEEGKTMWQRVEAVTRHPVINKDGTNTVLEVFTKDGRSVIATKAKSFLTINADNKLVALEGSDLKVGDYIPVNNRAFEMPENRSLDLSNIISKKEYVFGSEVHKALKINQSYKDKGLKKAPWWKNHADKDFILPYKRSDAFLEAASGIPREGCSYKQSFLDGIVYPKKQWMYCANIPESIELDFDFGYLIGAYLAEGCVTDTQISIANNDLEYFVPINRLTAKWGITTKVYKQENKCQEGWTSTDLRIYSTVLTDILRILCGKGSENKSIHNILFNSNKEFMKGLISAYFGGDGSCEKDAAHISAFSVSRKLLENIQTILCYWFGIYNKIIKKKKQETNNRGSQNILQGYTLSIKSDGSKIFAKEIPMFIGYKQEALNKYIKFESKELRDIIPRYVGLYDNYEKVNRRTIIEKEGVNPFENVRFDEIIRINEIPNPTDWVYDLTVENTRTFALINGVLSYDTFHFAGISAKSAVTRGLPRIKEIISVSKNIKSPSLTVYLEKSHAFDKEKAKSVLNTIEITTVKDICLSSKIYFDPATEDDHTQIEEDKDLMEIYSFFQDIESTFANKQRSPWILRLEFDKSKMFDKDIRMTDVYYAIQSKFNTDTFKDKDISFIYSDDNASKLIFRFQFNSIDDPNNNDSEDMILTIKNLEKTVLSDIVIKGVKGINSVAMEKTEGFVYRLSDNPNDYSQQTTWVLYTEGSNLIDIFSHPNVDFTRTISNNIYEIYETLGIEAAREVILNEITDLISGDGTYVNYRHIALLADTMTNKGNIMSIDRHGINKSDRGPLPKCSFEETVDMLAKAAIFGELDKLNGVSSNIMFGQEVPCGTGMVDVLFDEEKYFENLTTITEVEEEIVPDIDANHELVDMYCAESNFEFSTTI